MTYEEKLEKVIQRLKENRELSRKGHKTQVTFNDKSFQKVRIGDICKLLLQLQDDESALKILDALQPSDTVSTEQIIKPTDDDDYKGVVEIIAELDENFDNWYEKYLMWQKTSLKNLDYINMLRIYDTVQDINEQIQLISGTTVVINLLPSLMKYKALFPADTIGFRQEYCDHRLDSLKYLQKIGVVTDYSCSREGWDSIISVSVILSKYNDFHNKIVNDYISRNKVDDDTSKKEIVSKVIDKVSENKTIWFDNFKWDRRYFIFGKYGKIQITSKDRKHILKTLTDKKGGWATIHELKGNKDAGYVRSTIKQLEDRLPPEAKGHIAIISTVDDDSNLEKPSEGAYRIKVTP